MVADPCGESDETRLGKTLAISNFTGACWTEGDRDVSVWAENGAGEQA